MGITSTPINIPDYMEGLLGVRLEGHPALHLVMDPDHPIPIPSALASPQEADWETGIGGAGGHSASIQGHVFFSSVGLMNRLEENV